MRRAFTILAVMLVITIGALVATSTLHTTNAQHSLIEASIRQTRSRAMAWSGVQAAMSELAEQRDDLLDGLSPVLTEQWDLFELDDGRRGVVRLVAIGEEGSVIQSESGKLNVNTATADMLALIPGLDLTVAQRIVESRSTAPIGSVESLADIEGITLEALYGRPEAPGLTRYLTALSADPNVQTGVGSTSTNGRGDRKLNVNGPWSERLGRAIADRYDEETAAGVKQIMESGFDLSSESRFVAFMRQSDGDPETWVDVLDVFSATPDPYTTGRVDLLTAPAAVLAAIPGLDQMTAESIVQARASLDDESRRTVVWPVLEGVMTEEQFQEAIDFISSRSMQWRVRVEVGIMNDAPVARVSTSEERGPQRTDMIGGSFRGADDGLADAPRLRDRLVLEAVIDVSSLRPRVAYLRDVTHLDLAFRLDALRPEAELADIADDDDLADPVPMDDDVMTMRDAPTFEPFDEPVGDPTEGDAPLDPQPATEAAETFDEGEDRRVGRWCARSGEGM